MKMISMLEHLSFEERLRELELSRVTSLQLFRI